MHIVRLIVGMWLLPLAAMGAVSFEFNDAAGSKAFMDPALGKHIKDVRVVSGMLAGAATGNDPYLPLISGLKLDAVKVRYCAIQLKATARHNAPKLQLFLNVGSQGEPLYADTLLTADGDFHEYLFDLAAIPGLRSVGTIANFRVDPIEPAAVGDTFVIDRIRFYSEGDDLSDLQRIHRTAGDGAQVLIQPTHAENGAVTGDGELNEPVWAEKEGWQEGFVRTICEPGEATTLARGQTRFKIAEDDRNLYVAVVCDSIDPGQLDVTAYARNELALFNHDAVEIFIAGEREPGAVYQLGITPSGSYAELMDGAPCFASAEVYTKVTKRGYQAEVVIEKQRFAQLYKEMNRQVFADIWAINIARTQTGTGENDRHSSWIYTGKQYNNRSALAILQFGKEERALEHLAQDYVNELRARLGAKPADRANETSEREAQLRRQIDNSVAEIQQAKSMPLPQARLQMIRHYATATSALEDLNMISFSLEGMENADHYWFSPPMTERPNPQRLPARDEIVDALNVRLARNEKAGRRFSIFTRIEMKDVSITWGNLAGPAGEVISKDAIDVRIVKRWNDRGDADLLATDLRIPLAGWLKNYADAERFVPAIAANSSEHFVIKIRADKDQLPGIYTGVIHVSTASGNDMELPVQAEVLPFELLPTSRRVGFWYSGAMAGQKAHSYQMYNGQTTEHSMLCELKALREDGFNDIDLPDYVNGPLDAAYTRKILSIAKAAGFENVVLGGSEHIVGTDGCKNALPETPEEKRALADARKLLAERFRDIAKIAEELQIDVRIFGVDEPRTNHMFAASNVIFEEAHKAGLKTRLAVLYSQDAERLEGLDEMVLVSQFATDTKTLEWMRENRGKYDLVGYYPNYTADGTSELRLMYGWFFYKSGLDASVSWAYYATAVGDPFYVWAADFHLAAYYAFPTRDEPVPTLKYEAVREGLNDLRYLETLAQAIAQCGDAERKADVEAKLRALLDQFEPGNNAGMQSRNYFTPHSAYDHLRAQVQDLLIEIGRP